MTILSISSFICGIADEVMRDVSVPGRYRCYTEQVSLTDDGGLEAFLRREVLPYAPDAWHTPDIVKVGNEISFARHFYRSQPFRLPEEIRADILALERETEGLLAEIV